MSRARTPGFSATGVALESMPRLAPFVVIRIKSTRLKRVTGTIPHVAAQHERQLSLSITDARPSVNFQRKRRASDVHGPRICFRFSSIVSGGIDGS